MCWILGKAQEGGNYHETGELIQLLNDEEEKSSIFEESSSSSASSLKLLLEEVIERSTLEVSFGSTITINEQSSKESTSTIFFEESTSRRIFKRTTSRIIF